MSTNTPPQTQGRAPAAPMRARRLGCARIPAALLVALLQRTPATRVAVAAVGHALGSPAAAVIRAGAACAAALGAIDSVAGATTYTLVTTPNNPSPYTVTQGSAISAIVFSLTPATLTQPGSWTISGPMPPGLSFGSLTQSVSGTGAPSMSRFPRFSERPRLREPTR